MVFRIAAHLESRSFLCQCPPTLLAMLLTWMLVPNVGLVSSEGSIRSKFGRVDFLGAILLASATLLLLLPLELAGNVIPWTHFLVFSLPVLSLALMIVFVYVENNLAKEPIFAPRILAAWNIILPNTINFCQAAAQLGVSQPSVYVLTVPGLTYDEQDDVYCSDILRDHTGRVFYGGRSKALSSGGGSYRRRASWRIYD
jgi:hypothetical protein